MPVAVSGQNLYAKVIQWDEVRAAAIDIAHANKINISKSIDKNYCREVWKGQRINKKLKSILDNLLGEYIMSE